MIDLFDLSLTINSFGVLQVESPANFGSSPMFITPTISSIGSKIPTKAPTKAPIKKVGLYLFECIER